MKYINPYKLFAGVFVPHWLLERTELSFGAKFLYALLAFHARASGWAKPGQDVLADELGISVRQVKSYVSDLKYWKLIEVIQLGLRQTNRYRFLNHDWMHHAVAESDPEPMEPLRRSEEYSDS